MGSVEPLLINDVAEVEEFLEIPAVSIFQMRSYIGVPIVLSTGRVYGTLCALDRRTASNTRRDLDYLLLLARLLASQLDRRELGIAEERNRLAREIHDTLAQTLSALVLDLSAHAISLRDEAPGLVDEAGAMQRLAQEALREVRRSVWNLQPGQLSGRTLSEALGAEVRALERFGVSGVLEVHGTVGELPPAVEAALLRIGQEALANVRKHARATTVIVTLEFLEDDVLLRIDDDGRGIEAGGRAPRGVEGGFGLQSMGERARAAGGDLVVRSRPGGGTSVECVVPRWGQPVTPATRPGTAPPAGTATIRLGIIDDHTLVREGLRRLLDNMPEVEIVLEAGNGAEGLSGIRAQRPDVVLLDIQMPELTGLQVLEQLREAGPATRAIVLTTFSQDEMVFQAVRLGAKGYLLKETTGVELRDAIRAVAAGGTLLTPVAAGRLATRLHEREALTGREREVLTLIAEGLRNKEIAARLGTTEKTVQFHAANLFGKLGAQSRTEAVRIARERGLILSDT